MDEKNKKFLVAGLLIALAISVIAVFLASSDPDGLDSTALIASGQKTLTAPATGDEVRVEAPGHFSYSSPMQDYTLGERWGPLGGIIAMVIGTLLAFIIAIGLAYLFRKQKENGLKKADLIKNTNQ
jgi:cobalt/nickel transport protein